VDLSPAGRLGPRYLGLVSWRRRRAGWPAPRWNKSLRPGSCRGGVRSGAGVRVVGVCSSRLGLFLSWWVCTGAWFVCLPVRRLVDFRRLPPRYVGDEMGGGAVPGGVMGRSAVRASFARIRGHGGAGRVPDRCNPSVLKISSQGAGDYCGSCQSHRAMWLLLAGLWCCSSPAPPGGFFDDDVHRRWRRRQSLLARAESHEGVLVFLFFSWAFSAIWGVTPPPYPCTTYLCLYVFLIF